MASVNKELYDSIIRHTVDLLRVQESEVGKVLRVLKQLERDVIADIADINPSKSVTQSVRLKRLKALQEQIHATIASAYKNLRDDVVEDFVTLGQHEVNKLRGAVSSSIQADLTTVGVPRQVIEKIAAETILEGRDLKSWFDRLSRRTQSLLMREIRKGIMEGEGMGAIIERVASRKLRNLPRTEAATLVRTGVLGVSNDVRDEWIRANSDLVKGVQSVVTLDTRTSEICMSRSATAWNLDGSPMEGTDTHIRYPGPPPWHFNCRTTIIPVVKSWGELGEDVRDRIPKSTRASMTGQVAEDLSYDEWLRTQPEEVQVEALGPARYALWKSGKISTLRELVNQRGRPLTVKELEKRAG